MKSHHGVLIGDEVDTDPCAGLTSTIGADVAPRDKTCIMNSAALPGPPGQVGRDPAWWAW